MKKSQLRKIIKESIKQLMTEQATPLNMQISTCWGANTRYRKGLVNGQTPQVGQILDWILMGRTMFITRVSPNPFNSSGHSTQNFSTYSGTTCCPHLCGTTVPNITPVWFTSNPNYSMTGMNNVGCSGNGPMCCGNPNYNPIQTSNNSNFTAIAPQGTPLCPAGVPGCTDSQAINFNSNATQDDGSCDYGFDCNPTIGTGQQFGCGPSNSQNPGQYTTLADCQAANSNIPNSCGGGGASGGQTVNCSQCQNGYAVSNIFQGISCPQGWQLASLGDPCKPGGGPVPTDPILQTRKADPTIDRMQKIANISKK